MSVLTAFHALFTQYGGPGDGSLLTMPPSVEGFCPDFPKPKDNGGKRILVIGGGGAVGGMVVQLANMAGAGLVAATCSAKDMGFVKGLGAYAVVDYRDVKGLENWRHHFHGVIDCVGGEQLTEAFKCVRPNGVLFSVVCNPEQYLPPNMDDLATGVSYAFFIVKPSPERLESMTRLLRTGHLRPIFSPENVLTLDQYEEIGAKMKNKSRGKLVVRFDTEEPTEIIEMLQKHGEVPELYPQPKPARARGVPTKDILKIYEGNRALQRKIRASPGGGMGGKRSKKKARVERIKALQAALVQADDAGPASDAGPDPGDAEMDDAYEL